MPAPKLETDPYLKVGPAIDGAIRLISSCGWVRGALCTEFGYCVAGALIAAEPDAEVRDTAFDFIRDACNSRIVSQWNDTVAENKKEVVKVLQHAARRAREPMKLRKAGPERGSIYA